MTNARAMSFAVYVDWDNDGSFLTAGDDITSYVESIDNIQLGIQDDMLMLAYVGTADLTLKNTDRRFSPSYTGGPLYGKLVPDKPIKVTITDGVTTWPLFYGFTKSFTPQAGQYGTRKCALSCQDVFGVIQDQLIAIPLQQNVTADVLVKHIVNYALKAPVASGSLAIASTANNDTYTVGGITYTFKTTLSGGANEIKIGASVAATAINAAAAINRAAGAGTLYATNTTQQTQVSAATGLDVATYSDANQDSDVLLRVPGGSGDSLNTNEVATTYVAIGTSSGSDFSQTQQWKIINGGRLSQFTFTLTASTGAPTGTITWRLYTDNGATAPGSLIASGTVTPVASSTNTVNITNGPVLSANTLYWLDLRSTNVQTNGNYWNLYWGGSDTYPNGSSGTFQNGTWNPALLFPQDTRETLTTTATTQKDKLAQSFTNDSSALAPVDHISLWLKKVGAGTRTLTLRVETDNAGSPSGTLYDSNATATLAESSLSTTYGWATFVLPATITLPAGGTAYHLVLSIDGSLDGTNYVVWGADASSPGYAGGAMFYYAGSTWTAESKDAIFKVNSAGAGSDTVFVTSLLRGAWGNSIVHSASGAGLTASAAETITITATDTYSPVGNQSGTAYREAQSFTPAVGGILTQFAFTLGASTGTPSGTMTWEIRSDGGGTSGPGSTIYRSGTLTPTPSATNTVTITGGPLLLSGVKYWLVLISTNAQALDNYWTWALSLSSTYAGGNLSQSANGGASWSDFAALEQAAIITLGSLSGGADYPFSPAPSIQAGLLTFTVAADKWSPDAKTNCMNALSDVVASERGMLWVARDGTITFKAKDYLFTQASAAAALTLSSQENEIDGSLDREQVYSRVDVTYAPRVTIASGVIAKANAVIQAPGQSGMQRWNGTVVNPGGGATIQKLPFVDPSTGAPVAAQSIISPLAAGTDFVAADNSTGITPAGQYDYTYDPSLIFSLVINGSNCEVSIKNTALGPLWIANLQVRGVGLVSYNTQTKWAENGAAASVRVLTVDLPLPSSDYFAQALADYLLARFDSPQFRIGTITFNNQNLIGSVNLFSLNIGDVIGFTDYQTGVTSQKYLILGMNYGGIMPKASGAISFVVYRLDDATYFVIDTSSIDGPDLIGL